MCHRALCEHQLPPLGTQGLRTSSMIWLKLCKVVATAIDAKEEIIVCLWVLWLTPAPPTKPITKNLQWDIKKWVPDYWNCCKSRIFFIKWTRCLAYFTRTQISYWFSNCIQTFWECNYLSRLQPQWWFGQVRTWVCSDAIDDLYRKLIAGFANLFS